MITLEIVTHCWAGKYRHYADALVYQLSSLMLYQPEQCSVRVTVCFDPDDKLTCRVLRAFLTVYNQPIKTIKMKAGYLGRRSIGRNAAALETKADLVWFADVDQVWRGDCLDRLSQMEWPSDASMIYPKDIMIHRDHVTGDNCLKGASDNIRLRDVDPTLFVKKHYTRAIGGVQIVQGDFARQYGYLKDAATWQLPTQLPFSSFRDDIAYRNFCKEHGRIRGVDLPGMYRLRHSQTTYQ